MARSRPTVERVPASQPSTSRLKKNGTLRVELTCNQYETSHQSTIASTGSRLLLICVFIKTNDGSNGVVVLKTPLVGFRLEKGNRCVRVYRDDRI